VLNLMRHTGDARFAALIQSIPEFWECFTGTTVKQSPCVGRAGLSRPPRDRGTGCLRAWRQ
jgi:hypothetical protein